MSYQEPDEATLQRIREWPAPDFKGLLEFVKTVWCMPDWGWSEEEDKYYVSTGGMSDNEEIIRALQANRTFWHFCWESSRRGGHYVFRLV